MNYVNLAAVLLLVLEDVYNREWSSCHSQLGEVLSLVSLQLLTYILLSEV